MVFRATTGLTDVSPTVIQTDYVGRRGPLLRLALVSSLLTVLTLGIYRFWMKTRLRRYFWSSIRPGGHPLEYVGLPMEKLLGFMIAVVFMAFYIGVVNLLLMFASFSLLNNNFWAYGVSLFALLPLVFYAKYRARRYVLARTRWRGVRFGVENGAWAYSWRALLHWLVTILSGGLLWPRMTFWLEKFRTDRTFYGSERMRQNGRWQMLYRAFLPYLAGLLILVLGAVFFFISEELIAVLIGLLGTMITGYGLIHYRVHSFRILTNHKQIGPVGFVATPRTWRVIWIYGLGYGLVGLAMSVVALVVIFSFSFLTAAFGVSFGAEFEISAITDVIPLWVASLFSAVVYFGVFVVWGALKQGLITLPVARHYAETISITGAHHLAQIGQRDRDEMEHAEGFAEALDLGAAF